MSTPGIIVFGIASDASLDQWDGHKAPRGIMLRWFLPDLDFPPFGFDIYRAAIPDIPPLPFDDINVAAVSGQSSWSYAEIVTLSCANGLTFQPTMSVGWNALVIPPNTPVRVRFTGTAWRIKLSTMPVGAGIEVFSVVDGAETPLETLNPPSANRVWRTRHVGEIVLRGEGTVSFIGFHLLDDARFWTHIAHRCLPVHDAGYACGPRGAANEEDEAAMRLPAAVAADWKPRFKVPFNAMLPALRRLARGEPPAAVPPDSLNPQHPTLTTENGSPERALIRMALLDPHVARILGLAFDDPLVLDGQEYAYKVTGIWRGMRREVDGTRLPLADFFKQLSKTGVRVKYSVRDSVATINLPGAVVDFVLDTDGASTLEWNVQDELGNESNGVLDRRHRTLALPRIATLRLRWTTGSDPVFTRAAWYEPERRTGILPSVYARDPGAPVGPQTIEATLQLPSSPSAIASAILDWPLAFGSGSTTLEGDVIAYQVGHQHLGPPSVGAAPASGPATAKDIPRLYAPLYLSQQSVADRPPRKLYIDDNDGKGLDPGWWGWWVRGVDLFGRVSAASSWDVGKVEDVAPPPAPVLVQAEWVQRSLPPMTVAVLGRSVEASRWLMETNEEDPKPDAGLVVAWALPPEQATVRNDIDGFLLSLRKATAKPGAAAGAPLEYEDWPTAIAEFGPLQVVGRGTIVSVTSDPSLAVTLSGGEHVPEAPRPPTSPATPPPARTAFRTNITLDGASNVFVGGTLTIGTRVLPIVANGDGPNVIVIVEHDAAAPPAVAGAAILQAASGKIVSFETDVPDLSGVAHLMARSGLLLDEQATPSRFPVLRKNGHDFLCVNIPAPPGIAAVAPAAGHTVAWHPVWFASLSDTGFGPVADARTPVVNAEVAVQAIRLVQTLRLSSARSATLTVTAVDVAPPPTPTITALPFDPTGSCAMLASRADWYGDSRFTFSWTPQADCTFTVYRALVDEVFRLDRVHARGSAPRSLAQTHWPPGVFADAARKARVESELAAIDAALTSTAAAPDDQDTVDLVDAVYGDACNDAQMFLGLQPHTWAAFTPCFGRPIEANSYTDTLNGRTRAHWFYAVTARSLAGVESPPSTIISPPICCPDVVPPAPPLAHSALAAEGAVKLKWLASPDADTHQYEIYAARGPDAVANLDTLTPVMSYAIENDVATAPSINYAPSPHVSGTIIERYVPRARNEMGEWCFWIVATDTAGNRSEPSRMLRGRALLPPPLPPVWVSATRIGNGIDLQWTYPTGAQGYSEDPRWATLVQRRSGAGGSWVSISPWLPRGQFSYLDTLPAGDEMWEYRLRVRDHLGQMPSEQPTLILEATP